MTKYKIKISFSPKLLASDGSVYKLRFTVNQKIAETFLDILACEAITEKDHYKKLYLKQPTERKGDVIFLNLTQRDFFIKWALKNANIGLDKKRASYDANACLIIN